MSRKVIALILMSTITCCLLSGCKSASLTVSDKNDETKSEKDADEEDAEKSEEKSEETSEKEEEEKETDEAQSTEGYDLYSALSGQEFELSSVNPYDSNYRTWIEFKEDGSFSGSFLKDYYVESEDGEEDGETDGSFTGQLGKCTQVDQYTWTADIEEITYEVPANAPSEYSNASGLEGFENGSTEMTFYLPGKDIEELPDDVNTWLFGNDFGALVGYDMDWVSDAPQDLPFYVISTDDGCFSGRNVSGKNELYIKNKAKLPGIINQELTINSDGTYTCIDADEDGNIKFINICFEYDGFDVDVEECIQKIYGDMDYEYINIYGNGGEYDNDEWIYKPDWKWLNGLKTKMAIWSAYDGDSYVSYQARFISPYIDDDRYVFAYVVEVHSASEVIDAETAYMALGSLTFSGREDEISCAGGTDGEPYTELLIYCLRGQGQSLLGDEVEFVFEDDTDKIEEYGLDPDDFYNDYQIGGYDSVYDEYEISSQCVIYVQYAPDGMHRFLTIEEFNSYVPEYDIEGGRLMNIVLDKDGKVILIKEPYTP